MLSAPEVQQIIREGVPAASDMDLQVESAGSRQAVAHVTGIYALPAGPPKPV